MLAEFRRTLYDAHHVDLPIFDLVIKFFKDQQLVSWHALAWLAPAFRAAPVNLPDDLMQAHALFTNTIGVLPIGLLHPLRVLFDKAVRIVNSDAIAPASPSTPKFKALDRGWFLSVIMPHIKKWMPQHLVHFLADDGSLHPRIVLHWDLDANNRPKSVHWTCPLATAELRCSRKSSGMTVPVIWSADQRSANIHSHTFMQHFFRAHKVKVADSKVDGTDDNAGSNAADSGSRSNKKGDGQDKEAYNEANSKDEASSKGGADVEGGADNKDSANTNFSKANDTLPQSQSSGAVQVGDSLDAENGSGSNCSENASERRLDSAGGTPMRRNAQTCVEAFFSPLTRPPSAASSPNPSKRPASLGDQPPADQQSKRLCLEAPNPSRL